MSNSIKQALEAAYQLATERKYQEALQKCLKIEIENPHDSNVTRTLADIYMHMGNYSAAAETLQKLIMEDSQEPSDHFAFGRAMLFADNAQEAVAALSSAMDLGAKHGDHYYSNTCRLLRAEAYLRLGRYQETLEDCKYLKESQNHYFPSGIKTRAQIVLEANAGLSRLEKSK